MKNHVYQSVVDTRNLYVKSQSYTHNFPEHLSEIEHTSYNISTASCLNLVLKLINISLKNKISIPTQQLSAAIGSFLSENNLEKHFNYNIENFDVMENSHRLQDNKSCFEENYRLAFLSQDTLPENEEIYFTERELEIIKLTAQGLKAKEISEILFISTKTVNTHKQNIKHKCKFGTMMSAILYCIVLSIKQLI